MILVRANLCAAENAPRAGHRPQSSRVDLSWSPIPSARRQGFRPPDRPASDRALGVRRGDLPADARGDEEVADSARCRARWTFARFVTASPQDLSIPC